MSTDKLKQALEQEARRALDNSADKLSPEVQKRLQHAREAALNAVPKPWFKGARLQNPWLGWGLAASLCLTVYLSIAPQQAQQPQTWASNPDLDEFILIASLDETELDIIEDLEFAFWLSQQLPQQIETDDASGAYHNG